MTLVLDQLKADIYGKEQEQIFHATLNRLQIDNHGQLNPLFPVMLQPKEGAPYAENLQPCFEFYVSLKTNIENVQYINWFEFLLKELEIRIEIDHLMSIFEFVQVFNEKFGEGLVKSHQIFSDDNLTLELTGARLDPLDDEGSQ